MSNNKKNRLQQFVDSLPSDPDSDSQFAMVISTDSSSYGGDNTALCSNQVVTSCSGINFACTNYDGFCASGTNKPYKYGDGLIGCNNVRTDPKPIDPNI